MRLFTARQSPIEQTCSSALDLGVSGGMYQSSRALDTKPGGTPGVSDGFEMRCRLSDTFINMCFKLHEILDELANRSRYFGSLIGVAAGEPFYVREALNIDDPIDLLTRPMNLYS